MFNEYIGVNNTPLWSFVLDFGINNNLIYLFRLHRHLHV